MGKTKRELSPYPFNSNTFQYDPLMHIHLACVGDEHGGHIILRFKFFLRGAVMVWLHTDHFTH